ncbi:hypothetical protein JMUB3935_1286 [Leptotrichia trevisanii]|jgi:hypothetical protein|uniref:HTH cro/C1-type domain-containing protein n=2 Tax=Leptotrichia TaxID=32067 RepID=A0A510KKS1_9FUSO|nr:helix-turn-helix domain-containing protein [Leptotrichia trevisanii]BBM52308.1 hypothetical protein JMUB3935_1286 [Leptotrichia trevisanii]
MKNKSELEIIMYKNNDTIKKLSKELKIHSKTLSEKIKKSSKFKANEIKKIADYYNLSNDEIVCFFDLKSTL